MFIGSRVSSGVFWLSGSQLSLSDASAGEAQHSRLAAGTGTFEPQGTFPLALTLSAWGDPFKGNADEAQGIFGTSGRV